MLARVWIHTFVDYVEHFLEDESRLDASLRPDDSRRSKREDLSAWSLVGHS